MAPVGTNASNRPGLHCLLFRCINLFLLLFHLSTSGAVCGHRVHLPRGIKHIKTTNMPQSLGYRTVGYYVSWATYGRNYQPYDIPAEHLTHVLYAFANIHPDNGTVYFVDAWADTDKPFPTDSANETGTNVYGNIKQLYLLKKRNRNTKVLLSIGGASWSSNFTRPASTDTGRRSFAKSAVKLLKDVGFDGLDVDWEYPQNDNEASDFVKLLEATRAELDAYAACLPDKHHFLLTVACPAGYHNYHKLHSKKMDQYLDFWNLMAYDYAGSWGSVAGHQANLYPSATLANCTPADTDRAVEHYIAEGVHPSKIVLGMPLYGRSFTNTKGLGHSFHGVGAPDNKSSWEAGVWDYKGLPLPGSEIKFDNESVASYSYDKSNKTLITYDTPQVAALKVQYVKEKRLGGVMWWETSADKPANSSESLIKIVSQGLGGYGGKGLETYSNQLFYPESKYDNIKHGVPGE